MKREDYPERTIASVYPVSFFPHRSSFLSLGEYLQSYAKELDASGSAGGWEGGSEGLQLTADLHLRGINARYEEVKKRDNGTECFFVDTFCGSFLS